MNHNASPDLVDSFGCNKKCDLPEIDIISRSCKTGEHLKCAGQWSGFGFQVACTCKCGHLKEGPTLERPGGLHSNESQLSIQQAYTDLQDEPRV